MENETPANLPAPDTAPAAKEPAAAQKRSLGQMFKSVMGFLKSGHANPGVADFSRITPEMREKGYLDLSPPAEAPSAPALKASDMKDHVVPDADKVPPASEKMPFIMTDHQVQTPPDRN